MKNIFKFAAMAFAAVLLVASCEKKGDEKEPATLDGKVLKIEVENLGEVYLDFGVFAENQITMGMDLEIYGMPGVIGGMNPLGEYTIKATDATSGIITRTVLQGDGSTVSQDVPYKNLSEKSCTIDLKIVAMEGEATGEFVDVTLIDPWAE